MNTKTEIVAFGGGCFWCTEAVFSELKGVVSVKSGYTGGTTPSPTYEQVCSGTTGHVEVIRIEYDPEKITFNDLLTVFFATHDPTTLNQQGNDIGTQYRSAIFYTSDEQKNAAERFIGEIENSDHSGKSVVTEISPLNEFYEAEEYHRDYFKNNRSSSYCQIIIEPKVQKLQQKFADLLKLNQEQEKV